jgi:hypothetical protein
MLGGLDELLNVLFIELYVGLRGVQMIPRIVILSSRSAAFLDGRRLHPLFLLLLNNALQDLNLLLGRMMSPEVQTVHRVEFFLFDVTYGLDQTLSGILLKFVVR